VSWHMDRDEFDACIAEGPKGVTRVWSAYEYLTKQLSDHTSITPCKHDVRPCWDDIWMSFAHTLARRSVDPAFKTGAVIVTADNMRVLALGYNGLERGGSNVVDSLERGASGTVHAEVNALINATHVDRNRIMYVTLSPCRVCARAIVNAGINEVVYDAEYRDASGLDILRERGVIVRQFNNTSNADVHDCG
jgi:dCMP deaminase